MTDELKEKVRYCLTDIDRLAYKIGFCGPNECEQAFNFAELIRKAVRTACEMIDNEQKGNK